MVKVPDYNRELCNGIASWGSPLGKRGRKSFGVRMFTLILLFVLHVGGIVFLSELTPNLPLNEWGGARWSVLVLSCVITLVLQWLLLCNCMHRLRDLGVSPLCSLLLFVPYINVVVVLLLAFLPAKSLVPRAGQDQGEDE